MKSEVTFEQPILFSTFQDTESKSKNFNSKDLIQFTEESGIIIYRFESKKLCVLLMNGSYKPSDYRNSHYVKLITAPSQTKSPFCFIVQNNAIFKIDVLGEILHETNIHNSFFNIISLHASNKYLFAGTDSKCLIRIDYHKNNIHRYRFTTFNISNEKLLAITSFDDFIGIISSQSKLIIINQDSLKILIRIPLTFLILDDVQIKINKIDNNYSAAILTNSKIHIISFNIKPFQYTYQSSIPAESAISFDIHNNSVVVIRKINCNYDDFSCRASKISVYPHFSNEPQYEWDITKELDFIYQINIQPSNRPEIINDKLQHISCIFGSMQSSANRINSEIIGSYSPRQITTDQYGNLWITSKNSLLYSTPITEEIASFRGMLTYAPVAINNTNMESKKKKASSIAHIVYNQMTTSMHSEIDFAAVHNLSQIKEIIYQKSEEFYKENSDISEDIAEMFCRSIESITRCINNYTDKKVQDVENQVNNQLLNPYIDDFWVSILISQSYQIMKYFISLLMASYLFKQLKLSENKRIHNRYCLLNSQIEEFVCSFASIYNFTLSHQIKLNLKPLSINYDHLQNSLSKQFSYLFISTDYLIDFVDQRINESMSHMQHLEDLIRKSQLQGRQNPQEIISIISSFKNERSLRGKIEKIVAVNRQINEIQIKDIDELQDSLIKDEKIQKEFDDIFNYSSNLSKPDHLLVVSMIHLINGDINLFFKYFRRFKFYDIEDPQIVHKKFYDFVFKSTNKVDPQTYISFVNEEYEKLMVGIDTNEDDNIYKSKLSHFGPYFLNAIRIKDYDSAFNAFMGLSSAHEKARKKAEELRKEAEELKKVEEEKRKVAEKIIKKEEEKEVESKSEEDKKVENFAKKVEEANMELEKISILQTKSLERLIRSMKDNKCIAKFSSFPFGVHRLRILKLLSCGSPTSLFLAAAMYKNCGEFSKSGNVLLKYVHSVLCKTKPEESELRKAKSVLILIATLMKNHDIYLRDSMTMCLFDNKSLSKLRSNVEKLILEKKKTTAPKKNISRSNSNVSSTFLAVECLPISSRKAAFLLNNASNVNIDIVRSYTSFFLSKPNVNQQIYNFIKNLKNEEALQLFLAINFNYSSIASIGKERTNIRSQSKIYGLWLQVVFAQHNLQCFSGLIQSYIINEVQIAKGQEQIKSAEKQRMQRSGGFTLRDKATVSQKRIDRFISHPSYDSCSDLLKEMFVEKVYSNDVLFIRSMCNFPVSMETTMKLFPLVQIRYFRSLQCTLKHESISTVSRIFINNNVMQMIICCPRGKIGIKMVIGKEKVNENGKEIFKEIYLEKDIIQNDQFVYINNPAAKKIEIIGLEDNTEVYFAT